MLNLDLFKFRFRNFVTCTVHYIIWDEASVFSLSFLLCGVFMWYYQPIQDKHAHANVIISVCMEIFLKRRDGNLNFLKILRYMWTEL